MTLAAALGPGMPNNLHLLRLLQQALVSKAKGVILPDFGSKDECFLQ
jgi:hypothetical protein